jgi:hypothetical protein
LGSCCFSAFDSNRIFDIPRQCAERRTDVTLTSASHYAGHAGNIGHFCSHRHRGEGENCQR